MQPEPTPQRSFLKRIFLSPEEPRLRAGWRLIAQSLLMLFCILLFTAPLSLLFFALPDIQGSLPGGAISDPLLILGGAIQVLGVTVSVFLARRLFDRRSIASLGLALNRRTLPDLLAGVLLAGGMIGTIFVVELAAGWLTIEAVAWQVESLPVVLTGTLGMLVAFVFVGWYEELLFRGYWLQNLSNGLNQFLGVLISSAAFALLHLGNPGMSIYALAGLLISGVFLAYGYLRTRQMWLPVGIHIGWNFFEGTVFGFEVSGLETFRLIRQSVAGPELLTGGSFGPEAGLVLLPGLAVGTLLVYLYTRGRRTTSDLPVPPSQSGLSIENL